MSRPVKLIPAPTSTQNEMQRQLSTLTREYAENPEVAKFSINVDNRTGVVAVNMQHQDGRVQHTEWISKGLNQTTSFDPRLSNIEERNNAVLSLLDQGLTQSEAAKRTGISQSRVSQIKKSSLN